MQKRPPLISVLMPVYNGRAYVVAAIESILGQSLGDFEFIIVDDGSTDGSAELLQNAADRYERIKVISQANAGLSAALNKGLSVARGSLIARMDADDVALPERFEKQVAFLELNPNHVAVGSKVLLIDPEGAALAEMGSLYNHEQIDQAHLRGNTGSYITHPAAMIRRDAIDKVGGYRKEFEPAEDLDLFLRLAEVGRLANLPEVLLKYRQHPASIGYTRRKQQLLQAHRAAREACERRGISMKAVDVPVAGEENRVELSRSSNYRRWAWWALGAGHVATARKYALASVRRDPFAPESWKVMYCSLRGR